MAFVQFSGLSLAFGERDILKDSSLRLASGSRCCLTGANGSGKSTLMKIIAGVIKPDAGEYAIQKGARISYLPQSGIVHYGKSLREEVETAFSFVYSMIERLDDIGVLLEKSKTDEAYTQSLIEDHHKLQEQINDTGFYTREAEISRVLSGLGFRTQDINRSTEEFSGGWQMRIALAKVLLEKPDILLLDEPTNYLDIEAGSWLENWLKTFSGGYLLVSHDRYFLDKCVNEVYEIFKGNLKRYSGNYSAYEKTRKIELESLIKRFNEQQEEILKTQALIRRFRYKASKAAFAQDLIKRLEKMERIDIPESFKKINIAFPPAPHSGKNALILEGIGKSYADRKVIHGLDLCVEAGERLVVIGPNGAGKTTLLRIIAGICPEGKHIEYEGNVKYGTGVCAGYFSQDIAETMNTGLKVIQYLETDAPLDLVPKLRDMLGAFLFCGDDVYKSVSVLSGGEKSRLALLKLLLTPLNLLILDEPTNHLDLHSKDVLLEALLKFKGTIIFVSHDRCFMEALSTKTLELTPGSGITAAKTRLFYGNYAYYLDRVDTERRQEKPAAVEKTQVKTDVNEKRMLDKQRLAAIRRLERQEAEASSILEELEKSKTSFEAQLALPEVYSNGEKTKAVKLKIDECTAAIEVKTREWEAIVEAWKGVS